MYSLIDALARGENVMGKRFSGSSDIASSDIFNKILGDKLAGRSGGIKDIIAGLRERFPGANVKEGEVAPGVEGTKKAAEEDEDKTSDKVTVSPSVLENMLGNSDLAKMVENAISGFLEGSGRMMATSGSYVQLSVSITMTTVRYGELHRSEETGEVMAASELQTSLQEKLREMLQQFLGAGSEDKSDAAPAEKPSQTQPVWSNWGGASVSMWSMELFYSSAAIGAQGGNGSASASYNSFQFSASYSQFGSLTSGQLPSMLSDYKNGGGSGGLSDFLEELLAGFGMSGGGYRETGEGIFLKLSQSRNLIAELMEMYGDRIGGAAKADEPDAIETPAEVVDEQPAEEVAAAV